MLFCCDKGPCVFCLYFFFPFCNVYPCLPTSRLIILVSTRTPQLPAFTCNTFLCPVESSCGDWATQYMNKDIKGAGTGPHPLAAIFCLYIVAKLPVTFWDVQVIGAERLRAHLCTTLFSYYCSAKIASLSKFRSLTFLSLCAA